MAIDSIRDRLKKRLAEQAKGSEEDKPDAKKPDAKRKMAELKARLATLKTKQGSKEKVKAEETEVKLQPKPKPKKVKTQKPVVSDEPEAGTEPSTEPSNDLEDQVLPVDSAEDTEIPNDQEHQQDDDEGLSQEDKEEIERRISLLKSNSGLSRLRAVTNTKYKQVFEVAIEELREQEVSAWEAVLANAPSSILGKAIEKCESFQNKVAEDLVFYAFTNQELDDELAAKLVSLAEERGKISTLLSNLPIRIGLDKGRSLAEMFSPYILKGEPFNTDVTSFNLPFHIFLLHFVHMKGFDSDQMLNIAYKIINEFDVWSSSNKKEGLLLLPVLIGTLKGLKSSGDKSFAVDWVKTLNNLAHRIIFPKGVPVR